MYKYVFECIVMYKYVSECIILDSISQGIIQFKTSGILAPGSRCILDRSFRMCGAIIPAAFFVRT